MAGPIGRTRLGLLCRLYSTKSNRLTYVLVPRPPNGDAPGLEKSDSPVKPHVGSTWRPIDSSRLNLRHQFTSNQIGSSPPTSLAQDVLHIRSNQIDKRKDIKTSPEIIGPPKPPGPEDCCMSGCATCVYDIYAQETEEYVESLKQRNDLNQRQDTTSKSQETTMNLTEEIDDQVILNNSLKVFARFEKTRHR
ncbi:hypothetical protein PGT21_010148 [Puccinia graminis f. sp. tritici]|uniref:Oxidoreductase-like domain-containing protein n=1 Tax=Puccinia graminis f. sp. tritici TaxID=56615 RepID=A0A5B0S7L5_PUCGR|nr:hypothetical protein PGT21_010148 [Puccinia graminis f. sp. tritici]KAA1133425.1 hypothetical protein PGTUg99_008003 [Puccinia graminis f. sp. tritici]